MQGFATIQFQVGQWSLNNFGRNETPLLQVCAAGTIQATHERSALEVPGEAVPGVVVELGGLAPLMGIVEEVGELECAIENGDGAGMRDAFGDISIYLCDYCCRENIMWPVRMALALHERHNARTGVLLYLGKLYRCHLKRFQRIRGMHDAKTFDEHRVAALRCFVWHLGTLAREVTDDNLLIILNETWNGIVKKRDWKADAVTGGGHTHEAEDG